MKKSYWWPWHIPEGFARKFIMRMKLTSILLCLGFLQLSANGFSQEKLTVDYDNINIGKLLNILGKKSNYTFLYKNEVLPEKKISISMSDAHLRDILDKALEGTRLEYRLMANNLVVIVVAGEQVANQPVKGKVTDEEGTPLIGVTVMVKGTSRGTQTDTKGQYEMEVPDNAVLEFTYIGYEKYELKVAGKNFNVQLKPNSSGLNEIVVVGYGKQRKIHLSGAVDAVSGKALESRPLNNVGAGLQGLIPNFNITINDGRPTTGAKFNLRGYTSINGGDPFILVDNIPFSTEEVSRLNPADVESVTVLKDAASAAIYGARGAFGVVLITTKSGKDGRLVVSANANYAVRTLGKVPTVVTDPLTVMQYKHDAATPLYDLYPDAQRAYAQELAKNPGLPRVIVNPTDKNAWAYYGSTDWLHELYNKSASAYTADFSISRGDEKMTYYLSGAYYKQQGMLRFNPDDYTRYNMRGKVNYTFSPRFKLGNNTMFTNMGYDMPTFSSGNFFHNANRTPSLSVIHNPDGTYTSDGASLVGKLKDGGRSTQRLNEFLTTFNAELGLIKDIWTLKGDVTFRRSNSTINSFNIPVAYRNGPDQPLLYTDGKQSWGAKASNETRYNVINIYTEFSKKFNKKHEVGALLGFNQEYFYNDYFRLQQNDLISPQYPTPGLATGAYSKQDQFTDWAVRGIFYRLNYTFLDKYMVEFNGRKDGTSKFPIEDRWGFFPSASAAWVLSKEKFFSGIREATGIEYLKFRGSYGVLGDQTWGAYDYLRTMKAAQIGTILEGERPIGVTNPAPVSPSLTWQQIRTVNAGVDLSILKDRLNITFDRYTRYTDRMLANSKTLPGVFGATPPQTNAADLKTKGWELSILWRDQFKLGSEDLHYGVKLVVADSRSFITRYDNPTKRLSDYYVGQEIGEIWGLETEGFFQNEAELKNHPDQSAVGSDDQGYKFYVGDLKFRDLDGNGKIDYGNKTADNPGDRRIIGNSMARLPYSIDLFGDWKGFDLRVFIQGIGKRDWYPGAGNHYFWGIYAQPWANVQIQNLDHWTPQNPDGYYPRVKSYIAEDESELGAPQTRYLQNAAYLRLKNVTIGYMLPKSITEKMKIARLRCYFSAENIFTMSRLKADIDPEGLGGSIYPFQKTYSFGLNMTF